MEAPSSVQYSYDNSGALATVTDSESGITSKYYYDLIDRLCKYEEAGQDYSFILEYAFDDRNQVSQVEQIIDGNRRTIEITYDDDGRVTSHRNAEVTESYTYDNLGRLSTKTTALDTATRLTETLTYRTNSSGNATGQVNTISINAPSGYHIYFTYGYDMNGNIAFVKSGDMTTNYTYDSAGQLIREDNQAEGKSWTWVYDNAGNILSKKEYAYTTGTLGTATDTVSYVYDTGSWGDLLTSFDGKAITYDNIGNPLTIGNRSFTWKHGRELESLTENGVTWTNTYNADGLRVERTNGTLTYKYYYSGGQLVRIDVGNKYIDLSYDASGQPMSLYYSGYQVTAANYYYVTNLQGDVIAILDGNGQAVVTYTYDAWGNILNVGGTMADTLGVHNPLRYRGYVYDEETSLYYLQSRYYDSNMGRFLNADAFASTGQGFVGNNMFVYCGNSPVLFVDYGGELFGVPTLADYYTIHKLIQFDILMTHGYAIEVYVVGNLGRGFLDVYDGELNVYYEVKSKYQQGTKRTTDQMKKYDNAYVESWILSDYTITSPPTRGKKKIQGSFYYKEWKISYETKEYGLILYDLEKTKTAKEVERVLVAVGAGMAMGSALNNCLGGGGLDFKLHMRDYRYE